MTGEVDQNVDAVAADTLGDGPVGHAHGRPPAVRQAAETSGFVIGPQDLRVTKHLEPTAVMPGDDRVQEVAYRVLAEVGRDIADAQPAFGIAVVGMGPLVRGARHRMNVVPAPTLSEDFLL